MLFFIPKLEMMVINIFERSPPEIILRLGNYKHHDSIPKK